MKRLLKSWSDLATVVLIVVLVVYAVDQSAALKTISDEGDARNHLLQEIKANNALQTEILQEIHRDNQMRNNMSLEMNHTLKELKLT